MKIAEAAELVLKDATVPMSARDIAASIQARELFEFRTSDVAGVVSKALRRNPKFVKTAQSMFALR